MPEIKFGCTLCGKCCQGHSLPLTFNEAIAWLEDGGRVEIFCEAHPYLTGIPRDLSDNPRAEHRRLRSFRVKCGSALAHVTAILVGVISGSCRNLGEDLNCKIYERRPLVCRIYPAEISPFIQLTVAAKACPPEAWMSEELLLRDGQLVDGNLRRLVELSKQTDREDVPQKMMVCGKLGINVSAVADEGYVAHRPEPEVLLEALLRARATDLDGLEQPVQQWRLYSPDLRTWETLANSGFEMAADAPSFIYGAAKKPAA